jgi:hypothetical protein
MRVSQRDCARNALAVDPLSARRPPFRADHIGSLLRSSRLRQAFRDHSSGRLPDAGFRAIQDDAIRAVVALQTEIGFGVVNDGEYRRGSYWGRFVERTHGLGVREARFKFRDDEGQETEFTAPFIEAPVRREAAIAVDEVRFVRALTEQAVKVTLPAPSTMHFWRGQSFAEPGVYASATAFFEDLGRVYRAEIADLAQAGAQYVQLDVVGAIDMATFRIAWPPLVGASAWSSAATRPASPGLFLVGGLLLGRSLGRRFHHRRRRDHDVRVRRSLPHHPRTTLGPIRRIRVKLTDVRRKEHDVRSTYDPLVVSCRFRRVRIGVTGALVALEHVGHADRLRLRRVLLAHPGVAPGLPLLVEAHRVAGQIEHAHPPIRAVMDANLR